MRVGIWLFFVFFWIFLQPVYATISTLEKIKQRGWLSCAVPEHLVGFGFKTGADTWVGFNIDICRAVAAAVLGDATKVEFISLKPDEQFNVLYTEQIDILNQNNVINFTKNVYLDVAFPMVHFYDGQGFMVSMSKGINAARQLNNGIVCTDSSVAAERARTFFKESGLNVTVRKYEDTALLFKDYAADKCLAYSNSITRLGAFRALFSNKAQHIILPETISKEPLSVALRGQDREWVSIVRWALYALVIAEELGLDSGNMQEALLSKDKEVRYLLGVEGDFGKMLGVSTDWVFQMIKQVGNYKEIYERSLGENTPLGLVRGRNALYKEGGLLYAPPFF